MHRHTHFFQNPWSISFTSTHTLIFWIHDLIKKTRLMVCSSILKLPKEIEEIGDNNCIVCLAYGFCSFILERVWKQLSIDRHLTDTRKTPAVHRSSSSQCFKHNHSNFCKLLSSVSQSRYFFPQNMHILLM